MENSWEVLENQTEGAEVPILSGLKGICPCIAAGRYHAHHWPRGQV